MALLHSALPWVLLSWDEQYIDSALASILNGTTLYSEIICSFFWCRATECCLEIDRLFVPIGLAGLVC